MDDQEGRLTIGVYREQLERAGYVMHAMGFSNAEGPPVWSACFTRGSGEEGRILAYGETVADAWREAVRQARLLGAISND